MQNKVKQNTSKTKWAKFTYVGKETKFITKLLKKYSPENCFNLLAPEFEI
jgi:hypothetical protein